MQIKPVQSHLDQDQEEWKQALEPAILGLFWKTVNHSGPGSLSDWWPKKVVNESVCLFKREGNKLLIKCYLVSVDKIWPVNAMNAPGLALHSDCYCLVMVGIYHQQKSLKTQSDVVKRTNWSECDPSLNCRQKTHLRFAASSYLNWQPLQCFSTSKPKETRALKEWLFVKCVTNNSVVVVGLSAVLGSIPGFVPSSFLSLSLSLSLPHFQASK